MRIETIDIVIRLLSNFVNGDPAIYYEELENSIEAFNLTDEEVKYVEFLLLECR